MHHPTPNWQQDRAAAEAVLTAPAFAFIDGAAGIEETTKHANHRAWSEVFLAHTLPADVEHRSTTAPVLGGLAAAPFAVAPMGALNLVRHGADVDIAAACAETDIPFVVSTMSSAPLETLAKTGARTVFQLYWIDGATARRDLVRRAEDAGCTALVITVDTPVRRGTERETTAGLAAVPTTAPMAEDTTLDPSLTWCDIERLVSDTCLPVYVKGVLSDTAARRARQAGAAGVIVSNHGGRQLDGALPTARALPAIVAATEPGEDFTVLVDGGLTSGTDILKAAALGASATLIGRSVLYGLARNGRDGVHDVLQRLRTEFDTALATCGCRTPAEARHVEVHWWSAN